MDLEELLVQEGVAVPPGTIRRALERAAGQGRHPVAALVDDGIVGEDVLAEVLARACGTVVANLEEGARDEEAMRLVSKDFAREHLLLPLSGPSSGKVKVAFLNPLDEEARAAVESAVGVPVQPLVGALGPLRQAVERAYAERTTRVVRAPASEMPPEITRRVQSPDAEGAHKDTAPLHRIEQEATIEQRHEALLLALIERGVLTRADYLEALKRLLSGRRER